MVKVKMAGRVERLRTAIGTGCPVCVSVPKIQIIGIGDPEPEMGCGHCGRRFDVMVLVYVGVNSCDI